MVPEITQGNLLSSDSWYTGTGASTKVLNRSFHSRKSQVQKLAIARL